MKAVAKTAVLAGLLFAPVASAEIITHIGDVTVYTLCSGDPGEVNNYDGMANVKTGPSVFPGCGFAETTPGVNDAWDIGSTNTFDVFGDVLFGFVQFDGPSPADPALKVQFNDVFLEADATNPDLYFIPPAIVNQNRNRVSWFYNGASFKGLRADVATRDFAEAPEPSTWAFALMGVALIGLGARFRKAVR